MGEISFDCPHPECRTQSSAFTTISFVAIHTHHLAMFAQCKNCNEAVIFRLVRRSPNADPVNVSNRDFVQHFGLVGVDPKPPEIGAIDSLPERVSNSYLEAEGCYTDGRMNSAAAMYRRTIERTLREIDPDQNGTLYHRIEALKDASALP